MWWSEEVKLKKERWKRYLAMRTDQDLEEYKIQNRKVKDVVKAAKEKSWAEFGEKMESAHKEKQKLFYRTVKSMKREKECPIKFVKDKSGSLLRQDTQIMERWREHFKELLNDGAEADAVEADNTFTLEDPGRGITSGELNKAIRKMKLGKAAGYDCITPEMVKYMGSLAESKFLELLNLAWRWKKVPQDWTLAVILPLFKKEDNRECQNH